MTKKICILTDSLSSGGAEKVAANMSISFYNLGYDVTIVSMTDLIGYEFKGKLYNFGLIKEQFGKFKSLQKFNSFFKSNEFDVMVDHRIRSNYFKEILFSKFIFRNFKIIYCVHHHDLNYYFSFLKSPFLSKLQHVKNCKFVSVSHQIKEHLNIILNINSSRIYNYVFTEDIEIKSKEESLQFNDGYILSVTRLDPVKQLDVLIDCYSKSVLPKHNIKLRIMGRGSEERKLKTLISKLNLDDYIEILSFRENPYPMIKNAISIVLSSYKEGFPMVLLEAQALKVPIISFNCMSGPSEIIDHEKTGLLVKDQDREELTNAMNSIVTNTLLFKEMKSNMINSETKFSENEIIKQWTYLIENEI